MHVYLHLLHRVFVGTEEEKLVPELISPMDMADDQSPVEADATEVTAEGDLEAIRALVLQAHPDVVPEMVVGDSVDALLASVESARSAYMRLAESWTSSRGADVTPVPAGGGSPMVVDPDRLPAAEKIRRGLQIAAKRKG